MLVWILGCLAGVLALLVGYLLSRLVTQGGELQELAGRLKKIVAEEKEATSRANQLVQRLRKSDDALEKVEETLRLASSTIEMLQAEKEAIHKSARVVQRHNESLMASAKAALYAPRSNIDESTLSAMAELAYATGEASQIVPWPDDVDDPSEVITIQYRARMDFVFHALMAPWHRKAEEDAWTKAIESFGKPLPDIAKIWLRDQAKPSETAFLSRVKTLKAWFMYYACFKGFDIIENDDRRKFTDPVDDDTRIVVEIEDSDVDWVRDNWRRNEFEPLCDVMPTEQLVYQGRVLPLECREPYNNHGRVCIGQGARMKILGVQEWSVNRTYLKGDLVSHNGEEYRSRDSHVSNHNAVPGEKDFYWLKQKREAIEEGEPARHEQ